VKVGFAGFTNGPREGGGVGGGRQGGVEGALEGRWGKARTLFNGVGLVVMREVLEGR